MVDRTIIRRIIEEKQGRLNSEELQKLKDWRALSDENQAYVDSFHIIWEESGNYSPEPSFDSTKAFESFKLPQAFYY